MRSKISASPRTSSCAVGSSSSTTPAPSCTAHNARARATRCHCPPESSVPPSYPRASTVSRLARLAAARRLERRAYHLVRRTCWRDVVAQRQLEADEILEHGGESRPPGCEIELAEIDAVDLDGAGLRVVKPAQELGQRGLAGAVLADDGERGSGGNGEIEMIEDRRAARAASGAGYAKVRSRKRMSRAGMRRGRAAAGRQRAGRAIAASRRRTAATGAADPSSAQLSPPNAIIDVPTAPGRR